MKPIRTLFIICLATVILLSGCAPVTNPSSDQPMDQNPSSRTSDHPQGNPPPDRLPPGERDLLPPTKEDSASQTTSGHETADNNTTNKAANENIVSVRTYPIVDTNQTQYYNGSGQTRQLQSGFEGQDAQYTGNQPSYTDNGNGTVTDNVAGLMWSQTFIKCDYDEAQGIANQSDVGGYDDWRVPTIKELYSLIDFSGNQGTGNPSSTNAPSDAAAFIDTEFFDFEYPSDANSRYIDAQYISSTEYVSTTMGGNATFFGVNFADGRIKGYPQKPMMRNSEDRYYLRLVRSNPDYGINQFIDNQDGTISDAATGLMWTQGDSGASIFDMSQFTQDDGSLNWQEALLFAENVEYAGYDDWRLPNAKELQSIVDYTRSPDTSNSAAIDPIFDSTEITNEAGQVDYAAYWSSTSFNPGRDAVVVYFGRGMGYFSAHGNNAEFMDVHGAGCQRTDPKVGEPSYGNGPQGDVQRVYNYVRLVRDVDITELNNTQSHTSTDNPANEDATVHSLSSDGAIHVITVGTGTPQYDADKASASVLIRAQDTDILIDCGEGAYANLMDAGYSLRDLDAILFTHLHLDHTADFTSFIIPLLIGPPRHFALVGPDNTTDLFNMITDIYAEDILYRMSNIQSKTNHNTTVDMDFTDKVQITELIQPSSFAIDNIQITTVEMTHTIAAYAYRLDINGYTVVVSGDTDYDPDLVQLAQDADMLIVDGGSAMHWRRQQSNNAQSSEPSAHMDFSDLTRLLEQTNIDTLIITHYSSMTSQEKADAANAIKVYFDGNVIFAEDMMALGVG